MVESNYDILGIVEGTTEKDIRDAFRRLALQFHSDRGGENEQFIKIKQAYDDLKIGKKYPDTDIEKIKNSRVYSDESEEDVIVALPVTKTFRVDQAMHAKYAEKLKQFRVLYEQLRN